MGDGEQASDYKSAGGSGTDLQNLAASFRLATEAQIESVALWIEQRLELEPPIASAAPQKRAMRSVLLVGAGYFGLKHLLNIALILDLHNVEDSVITVASPDEMTELEAYLSDAQSVMARVAAAAQRGEQVARALNAFTDQESKLLADLWKRGRIRLCPNESESDIRKRIETSSCDAVFVATPAHTHHGFVMTALKCGSSVFVEKPLATRHDHATEMVEAARRARRTLHVDNINLYDVNFIAIKELVKLLGDIRKASYSVRNTLPSLAGKPHAILEEGIHASYVFMHLLGEGELVQRHLRAEKVRRCELDGSLRADRTEAGVLLHGIDVEIEVDLAYAPRSPQERASHVNARKRGSSGVYRSLKIAGEKGMVELDFLAASGMLQVDGRAYRLSDLTDRVDMLGELHEFPLYNSVLHFFRRHTAADISVVEPEAALASLGEALKLFGAVELELESRSHPGL